MNILRLLTYLFFRWEYVALVDNDGEVTFRRARRFPFGEYHAYRMGLGIVVFLEPGGRIRSTSERGIGEFVYRWRPVFGSRIKRYYDGAGEVEAA